VRSKGSSGAQGSLLDEEEALGLRRDSPLEWHEPLVFVFPGSRGNAADTVTRYIVTCYYQATNAFASASGYKAKTERLLSHTV
jgi:hypothetical protein